MENNDVQRKTPVVRVVVVDDDVRLLRALQRRLQNNPNIELITFDNATDALLSVGALSPDLVVLDANMPELSGVEVCRRIKANTSTRDVAVVVTSGVVDSRLAADAQEAGADRAVAKPLDVVQLIESSISFEDEEVVRLKRAISAAQQHLHQAEERLLHLQRQVLARGTRDVLEQAREAVRQANESANDDLDKFS